jgi:hypothetical protein
MYISLPSTTITAYLHRLAQSWILHPSTPPTCIIGRYPPNPSPTSEVTSPDDTPKYCASLYILGKNGARSLDCAPKTGATRKEALLKLLGHVEGRIGEMMVQDRREMREEREKERERDGGRRSGGN